mgnify:CR=1 FL=1
MVRKTYEQPARLRASDLEPLREIVKDNVYDYALLIGGFHFINRIADLLNVPAELLPESFRRFEFLRRLMVRLGSIVMAQMDLANRDYNVSFKEALENLKPYYKDPMRQMLEEKLAPLKSRPKLIEALRLMLEEREVRSGLEPSVKAKVGRLVEMNLPAGKHEAEGFHPIPEDPVEAFIFVGTRYAYRTTKEMIDALRHQGYDDLGILDLATAIADANMWARVYRLVGLDPELYYVDIELFELKIAIL